MKIIRYLDRSGRSHYGSQQPDGSALRIDPQEKVAPAGVFGPTVGLRAGFRQRHQRADVVDEAAALHAARLVADALAKAADGRLSPSDSISVLRSDLLLTTVTS